MTKELDENKYNIKAGHPFPMGLTREPDGVNVSVQAPEDEAAELLVYGSAGKNGRKQIASLPFPESGRTGKIICMKVEGLPEEFAYQFRIGSRIETDSYARYILGREQFGKKPQAESYALCYKDHFDWEGDKPPCIPMEDTILYRLHVRGFTKHSSSQVKAKGTFAGLKEKIPYLKELGVTMVELLPAYEFEEVQKPLHTNPAGNSQQLSAVNYWGYTDAFYFAPKAAYSKQNKAYVELKELVRELHKNGVELCMEFYFVTGTRKEFILECLRYWVLEYHIDGFHINFDVAPMQMIAEDPLLSSTKLFGIQWEDDQKEKRGAEKEKKHLAEFHDGFLVEARKFLKGEPEQLQALLYRISLNPQGRGVVNYIANHDSLTLHDCVTYENKHNEKNGEDNRDGNNYNYSWNCGEEGESRRKKVLDRRNKQMRNALFLVLLSQGVPMLLAGDEFGRTKGGNNNAWCQDNEISWINWNLNQSRTALLAYTKELILFRKQHRIFHMPFQLRNMDYGKNGYPDISYHGTRAWYPDLSTYNRHVGIMYCGEYAKYAKEEADDFFYMALNSHWEEHTLALPNLPKDRRWYELFSTGEGDGGFLTEKLLLENQKEFTIAPASSAILAGIKLQE